MSGVAWAVTAGVGFGLFQAVNRRANTGIDPYLATFSLLAVGTSVLFFVTLASADLSVIMKAPLVSYAYFAGAGIIHFFFGWTFLVLSQRRIGAARTGAAVAATPLVGSVLAAVVLQEPLGLAIAAGIVLVVSGLVVLSLWTSHADTTLFRSIPWFGLAAAVSWGTSPLIIRWGLEGLPAPLIGVTTGIAAAMISYAAVLTVTRRWSASLLPRSNLLWIGVAGVLAAAAIAAQWMSYSLIAVAVAITLMQLSVPVVILTAPVIVGMHMERITVSVASGALLIVAGSIIVVLVG
ncbi:MAG: EamA family transporter [Acidimicrobiia bacterium]